MWNAQCLEDGLHLRQPAKVKTAGEVVLGGTFPTMITQSSFMWQVPITPIFAVSTVVGFRTFEGVTEPFYSGIKDAPISMKKFFMSFKPIYLRDLY